MTDSTLKRTIMKQGGKIVRKSPNNRNEAFDENADLDPAPAEKEFTSLLKAANQQFDGMSKEEREKLNQQLLSLTSAMLSSDEPIKPDAVNWLNKLASKGLSTAEDARKKLQEKMILDAKKKAQRDAEEAAKKAKYNARVGKMLENAQNEGMSAVGLRHRKGRGGR